MANIRAYLNDDALAALALEADLLNKPLEVVAGQWMQAYYQLLRQVPRNARMVLVSDPELAQLAVLLGGGDVLNGVDLLKKVERLAGISFRHIRMPFTPNQLEELQFKAERLGLTVEELTERIASRLYQDYFTVAG